MVGVEVGFGCGFGLLLAMFTTFTGGWVGGWCGEVKNRANLSQVRLKLRLSLATVIFILEKGIKFGVTNWEEKN